MEINRPINRRKALKVLGLGMLATCMPTLPACGNAKNEKKIKRLIFYFSATGNSLYVSRQIAGEEGTLLSVPRSRPIISSPSALSAPIARSSRSSWTIWPRRTVSR